MILKISFLRRGYANSELLYFSSQSKYDTIYCPRCSLLPTCEYDICSCDE